MAANCVCALAATREQGRQRRLDAMPVAEGSLSLPANTHQHRVSLTQAAKIVLFNRSERLQPVSKDHVNTCAGAAAASAVSPPKSSSSISLSAHHSQCQHKHNNPHVACLLALQPDLV